MSGDKKNIGFFGGSFSPPHYGHFLAACYALKKYALDEIWFCPTYQHALGKESWDFKFRLELCKTLTHGFEHQFKVSDIEHSEHTDGKTYNTLKALEKLNPDCSFKLIIGSDILEQKNQWYRFDAIEQEFGLCLVPRKGYGDHSFAIPNFSSTQIREALNTKDVELLKQLMPTDTFKLLQKNALI